MQVGIPSAAAASPGPCPWQLLGPALRSGSSPNTSDRLGGLRGAPAHSRSVPQQAPERSGTAQASRVYHVLLRFCPLNTGTLSKNYSQADLK